MVKYNLIIGGAVGVIFASHQFMNKFSKYVMAAGLISCTGLSANATLIG